MRGKAYRRHKHQVHDKQWRRIIDNGGYYPFRGYYKRSHATRAGQENHEDERYIQDNSGSKLLVSHKKFANRRVRRSKETFKRNDYKLQYDIWWKVF